MSVARLIAIASLLAALGYLAALAAATIVAAVRAGGRREEGPDERDVLGASRLTMPVSIIVPAGRSPRISGTIADLLDLTYAELEVIVVADEGLTDLAALVEEWQLEAREFFYRRAIETAPVRRIYRSLRDPRLIVVEKDPASRPDALNCGVNFARYRFVAVVPPAVSFERTALLSAMTPALLDPVTIVGVGSAIERVPDPRAIDRDARFQRMRSIRSLMFTRLFWSRLRRGLGPGDAVIVWRRDAVLQANGFSVSAADPELDMMFRLQRSGRDERRFVKHEDPFGTTPTLPAPAARAALAAQQRSTLRTAASWGPGASQSVGLRAFTGFLESELITPLAQLWIVFVAVAGAAAGWFSWLVPASTILLLSFGTATVTAAALLVRGAHPGAPDARELRRLVVLSPLEFVLYRPIQAWTRLLALFSRATH